MCQTLWISFQPRPILRCVLNCRRFSNQFEILEQILDVSFRDFLGPDPPFLRDSGRCPVLLFISRLPIGRKLYRKPQKFRHVSHEVSGADDSRRCSILLARYGLKLVRLWRDFVFSLYPKIIPSCFYGLGLAIMAKVEQKGRVIFLYWEKDKFNFHLSK